MLKFIFLPKIYILKFWEKISINGLEKRDDSLKERTTILTNQLNFALLAIFSLLLIAMKLENIIISNELHFGVSSARIIILILLFSLNIYLASKKKHLIVKNIIIFAPLLFFILIPTFIGFVEEESFHYYPFIIIALSIIPQLIIVPFRKNPYFLFTFIFFFFILLIMDKLLIYFASDNFEIYDIIKEFYFYYKLSHVLIFLFITSAIHYLRSINIRFEERLNKNNKELLETVRTLKNTRQQLIQSEKMSAVGTLVSGIAHEINNPLNYISGALEILDIDECKNNKQSHSIEMIKKGFYRINNVVKSLLSFSFKGSSKLRLTNINTLINNTLRFYRFKIPEEIKIITKLNLEKDIYIYQDKMHQIILVLIENAIQSLNNNTGEYNKRLIVETKEDSENKLAIISFLNEGSSIPENILSSIFEPFSQPKIPIKAPGWD